VPQSDKTQTRLAQKRWIFAQAEDDGEAFLVGFERPLKVALRLA
jgi:hypothetical protein